MKSQDWKGGLRFQIVSMDCIEWTKLLGLRTEIVPEFYAHLGQSSNTSILIVRLSQLTNYR